MACVSEIQFAPRLEVSRRRFGGAIWLLATLAALWPVWKWSAARLLDGSDEPWGIVAIAALGVVLWRERASFSEAPRPLWLLAASTFTCGAIVTAPWLPPLLRGVLASFAVTSVLMAVRKSGHSMPPYLMLALLSLPILSSLQFYLGFPLRVVTAEASAFLLSAAGLETARSGSALVVDGVLVMVDAPCAGIHMAWAAYFTASVAGAWLRLPTLAFLVRLSSVSLVVITMNVLRNTALVALETRPAGVSDDWHEAIGIVAFMIVCSATLWRMGSGRTMARLARAMAAV